jgi:hypothetical protein
MSKRTEVLYKMISVPEVYLEITQSHIVGYC